MSLEYELSSEPLPISAEWLIMPGTPSFHLIVDNARHSLKELIVNNARHSLEDLECLSGALQVSGMTA